ncbi:hypothetical protein GQ457_15G012600 [Hibiscus cannabinus]
MAPSKIRRAIGHVKDRTSISLAKVSSSSPVSDLEVAIVKATRHQEYPADERHVREILSLTSYSRSYVSACVKTLSKRLNKTRNWTVALKTLMLIQRLLSDGDPAYEQEIFFSTRRGSRVLNMSDFRDTSQSNSWDFSAFVRTYALYLDERLEYIMEGRFGGRRSVHGHGYNEDDHEDTGDGAIFVRSVPVTEMKSEHLFTRLLNLQQLLDRFLACRPLGAAKRNRLVAVALQPIVKQSFQIYYDITDILGVLIDRFMELDMSDSIKIYNIFCRERKQFDDLEIFYSWCKSVGIARSSDYPEIEKITQKKLDIIDDFIRDKSALGQAQKFRDEFRLLKETEASGEEEDANAIKALPEPNPVNKVPELEKEEVDNSKALVMEPKGDLLNLEDEAMSSQDYGLKLALALFGGPVPATAVSPSSDPGWEAFKDDSDWESALVQSASNLKNQRAVLGGGFDLLLLDSMYQQGAMASSGYGTTGSASSVAFGSVGRPATLALPAPPSSKHNVVDPFAASLAVEPPSYVQMSDMEKKQRFLVEEQAMWEQYRRDGMQGYGSNSMAKVHNFPYSPGYSPWHGY